MTARPVGRGGAACGPGPQPVGTVAGTDGAPAAPDSRLHARPKRGWTTRGSSHIACLEAAQVRHRPGRSARRSGNGVRRGRTGPGLRIAREDLRQATLEGREGNLVLFVVDASGSMGSRSRMGAVKGADTYIAALDYNVRTLTQALK